MSSFELSEIPITNLFHCSMSTSNDILHFSNQKIRQLASISWRLEHKILLECATRNLIRRQSWHAELERDTFRHSSL